MNSKTSNDDDAAEQLTNFSFIRSALQLPSKCHEVCSQDSVQTPGSCRVKAKTYFFRTEIIYSPNTPNTILYYTILYFRGVPDTLVDQTYTILYFTILYYTLLYYTILYYTILYYTILYYTLLYYTILYYTILYYTILHYTLLYPIPCF